MTQEEFIEKVKSGGRIRCDTPLQRRMVLEFFDDLGFSIGSATREHLNIPVEQDRDLEYMYPGYNKDYNHICLYRSNYGFSVVYEEIADIVEAPPKPLDERSDTEFASDLASLLC